MITGKITFHKEPTKPSYYQTPQRQSSLYDSDDGYDPYDWYSQPRKSYREIEDEYNALKLRMVTEGFVINARVERKSGNGGHGTIINIKNSSFMAWNSKSQDFECITVKWDSSPHNHSWGQFDYNPDDLVLVKEENTNAII